MNKGFTLIEVSFTLKLFCTTCVWLILFVVLYSPDTNIDNLSCTISPLFGETESTRKFSYLNFT